MPSVLHAGTDHAEGVAWDPAGWIVYGSESGKISRFNPETEESQDVGSWDGFVLGIALDRSGQIYACDMASSAVIRLDHESGESTIFSAGSPDRAMQTPNFPAFAPNGVLYVSDSGSWGSNDGLIFSVLTDGTTIIASTEAAGFTNGLALHPDGTSLYIVESSIPAVSKLRLREDGILDDYEVVVMLPDSVPDGLAFAADGTLLISCYRPDRIYRFRLGELSVLVDDATGMTLNAPTNLCFFGPSLDRLVTANLGGWHLTEVETTLVGAQLPRPLLT